MTCQRCSSERVALVEGKTADMCCVKIGGEEHNGYVPSDMGIGGSDFMTVRFCLDCGQIQGRFPLPKTALEGGGEDESCEHDETYLAIRAVIEEGGDFLSGGASDIDAATEDWVQHGFDEITVRQWGLEARCFNAMVASDMMDAGVTLDEAKTLDGEICGYVETLGYKCANYDISYEDILARRRS